MRIVRTGIRPRWLFVAAVVAVVIAALVPAYALAAPGIGSGPKHPAVVRMALDVPGVPVIPAACEVPTGEWLSIRGGGWGATTPELRQQFIDAVPVSITLNGIVVSVEQQLVDSPGSSVVLYSHLERPLSPGTYGVRVTYGPATEAVPDGFGGYFAQGEVLVRTRTVVVTQRGHFPATTEVACVPA